jgi:hypothetical protein
VQLTLLDGWPARGDAAHGDTPSADRPQQDRQHPSAYAYPGSNPGPATTVKGYFRLTRRPFVEQFVDRPDTRRRTAHLGACPTYRASSRQPRFDEDHATADNRYDRVRWRRSLIQSKATPPTMIATIARLTMFFAYPVSVPQEAAQRQAKKLAALESLHRARPSVGEVWLWGR